LIQTHSIHRRNPMQPRILLALALIAAPLACMAAPPVGRMIDSRLR
jgi:hypothetical protein